MPRVKPPEPEFAAPPEYQRTTYQQGTYGRPQVHPAATQPVVVPPPPLQSRTGRALKWTVSALLIAALGLGSWQIADRLLGPKDTPKTPEATPTIVTDEKPVAPKPVSIESAHDFDPLGNGAEKPQAIPNAYDEDPSTFWHTENYATADLGKLKSGVGLVLDLGKVQKISSVDLSFLGETSVELRTAPADAESEPSMPDQFLTRASKTGSDVTLKPTGPVTTRYVLIWLTELPANDGGFRGKLTEIKILG